MPTGVCFYLSHACMGTRAQSGYLLSFFLHLMCDFTAFVVTRMLTLVAQNTPKHAFRHRRIQISLARGHCSLPRPVSQQRGRDLGTLPASCPNGAQQRRLGRLDSLTFGLRRALHTLEIACAASALCLVIGGDNSCYE